MRATAIDVTENRATVSLRPCWLARLLGAHETVLDLEWYSGTAVSDWKAVASRRWLGDLPHARAIRDALDFRQRTGLPAARARRLGGAP